MKATKRRSRGSQPQVSLGGVNFEAGLPLPWVAYPGHYGTFCLFGADKDGPWHFCQCARTPLSNLVELTRRRAKRDPRSAAWLGKRHVPEALASAPRGGDSLEDLSFRPKLCHRCNLVAPLWRYCHEMYGGRFDQAYGWYVNQMRLRLGVLDWDYLEEVCPEKIRELVDANAAALAKRNRTPTRALDKLCQQTARRLQNAFTDLTREEFGFRKVGEGWVSETMLAKIVGRLFPADEMLRHHRPEWLQGLELDVFLPARHLAFEYQGQQHFHPIAAWGGEDALAQLIARDRRKARLCGKRGVTLVPITYADPLTEEFVQAEVARRQGEEDKG